VADLAGRDMIATPQSGAHVRVIARAIFVAVGFASAVPAFAADLPTKKPAPPPIPEPVLPSAWHVDLTGYLWATSLAGNTGIREFPTNPFFYTSAIFLGTSKVRSWDDHRSKRDVHGRA
jgi:hypothetical protein